jgi:Fe-S-cluster containining protein
VGNGTTDQRHRRATRGPGAGLNTIGESLCSRCAALCCRYFSLPVDTPKTAKDFDDIRWYLAHEGVTVYVDEGTWYVSVAAKCKYLRHDNLCAVYEHRPRICASYSERNCDYHGGDYGYSHFFSDVEQLEAYAKQLLAKKAARSRARSNGRAASRTGKNSSAMVRSVRIGSGSRASQVAVTSRRARRGGQNSRAQGETRSRSRTRGSNGQAGS